MIKMKKDTCRELIISWAISFLIAGVLSLFVQLPTQKENFNLEKW